MKSGYTSILELKIFDKVSTEDPFVRATTGQDAVGTLDASDPKFLAVWTASEARFGPNEIKILIHSGFRVYWHKERCKGVEGIIVRVEHDGREEFRISVWDEEAAQRVSGNMKRKLQHAQEFPEEYAGNSTTITELEG
ncbi:hypothetical protein B0A55_01593 [Friedmanniomyces simplex]|uniref:Uncharacterized protein n=1 Tax=Friedmanniomyces simplex TaxID=329884 RepID=A0A4U0XY59_9PEZI|nr:hypothetical protein B0A55_01593 [Friedmanniomyces simplex]